MRKRSGRTAVANIATPARLSKVAFILFKTTLNRLNPHPDKNALTARHPPCAHRSAGRQTQLDLSSHASRLTKMTYMDGKSCLVGSRPKNTAKRASEKQDTPPSGAFVRKRRQLIGHSALRVARLPGSTGEQNAPDSWGSFQGHTANRSKRIIGSCPNGNEARQNDDRPTKKPHLPGGFLSIFSFFLPYAPVPASSAGGATIRMKPDPEKPIRVEVMIPHPPAARPTLLLDPLPRRRCSGTIRDSKMSLCLCNSSSRS